MDQGLFIITMGVLAGVAGKGLGSVITALFGARSERTVSVFLSFAGGVMLAIVLLELIPEAIDYSSVWVAVLGLGIGVLVVLGLNRVVDRITEARRKAREHKKHIAAVTAPDDTGALFSPSLAGPDCPECEVATDLDSTLHDNYEEYFHAEELLSNKGNMMRAGIVILFAIALHNIPEGLAMGAAGQYDIALGITIALLIALHNIPEGMAISAPLISGGLSKIKTILLTMAAGATTVIGAVLGVLIGGISSLALALSLAIAGGAMLYVVLGEIFPQTIVTNKDRMPAMAALAGIVVAIIFIAII
ncbi:MAG: ZIP family metal transporter [Coriobacteriia bacterium]|nr:ZIP family metal transporter [Coriobacteriia bacterium]MCL2536874.1 ZIP family metal transporter [Coriobacteriia bacterium]